MGKKTFDEVKKEMLLKLQAKGYELSAQQNSVVQPQIGEAKDESEFMSAEEFFGLGED